MSDKEAKSPVQCDVLVAGAGAAGLSAAHAFAAQGRKVVVVGKVETHLAGRTVALFEGSLRFFRALGLWQGLADHAAPMEGIRLIDDTGSIFPTTPKEFRSREIDLDAFGENIDNNALVAELAEAARKNPDITLIEDLIDYFELNFSGAKARTTSGDWIEAKFIVAGEGRNSQARQVAGITVKTWTYPQTALTVLLAHEKPHHNISTEFHKRSGPFTFVPLRGREGAPYRSSLVWLVSPREALRLQALSPRRARRRNRGRGAWPVGRRHVGRTARRMADGRDEDLAGHRPAHGADRRIGPFIPAHRRARAESDPARHRQSGRLPRRRRSRRARQDHPRAGRL